MTNTTEKPAQLHTALRNTLAALKACSRKCYTFPAEEADYSTRRCAEMDRERVEAGDYCAVTIGPLAFQVAFAAGLTTAQARRYLLELEQKGLTMREPPQRRLTAHRWWPVGFSDDLQQERADLLAAFPM